MKALVCKKKINKTKAYSILKYGIFRNKSFRIDISTVCQLKCPECSRTKGEYGIIKKGFLSYQKFKEIVDKNKYIKSIELSNYGEIFLNPEIIDIIEYAHKKKITVTAKNGVNLNTVDEATLEALVKYSVERITVSIDGACSETYATYRKGGNFDTVIKNIETINLYKKKYESVLPHLNWQFILFGHNVHEINKAKKMARDLGMNFKVKLNWNPDYAPITREMITENNEYVTYLSRKEYEKNNNKLYLVPCYQLFNSPQINYDGILLGCCINKWISFGNIFELGLKKALKSDKFIKTKLALLGKQAVTKELPCFYCEIYKQHRSLQGSL